MIARALSPFAILLAAPAGCWRRPVETRRVFLGPGKQARASLDKIYILSPDHIVDFHCCLEPLLCSRP